MSFLQVSIADVSNWLRQPARTGKFSPCWRNEIHVVLTLELAACNQAGNGDRVARIQIFPFRISLATHHYAKQTDKDLTIS
jgi:hypothetical protein